jgi:hypothetical protein
MLKARQLRKASTGTGAGAGAGTEKELDPAKIDGLPSLISETKIDVVEGAATRAVSNNDDSGDEQEQREVERLLRAEQDRLAAIQSLGGVLPETRHDRLVTIASATMPSAPPN